MAGLHVTSNMLFPLPRWRSQGRLRANIQPQKGTATMVLPGRKTMLGDGAAPIGAVTVFLDKAEVTREARVDISPGTAHGEAEFSLPDTSDENFQEIVFTGLTKSLEPDSIQVSGEGGFVIHEVRHELVMTTENQSGTSENFDSRLRELQKEKKQLEQLAVRIDKKKQLLKSYSEIAAGGSPSVPLCGNKVSSQESNEGKVHLLPADMGKVLDFYSDTMTKLDDQSLDNEERLRKVRKEIDEVLQTNPHIRESPEAKYNVHVILQPTSNQTEKEAVLQLRYIVKDATWSPSYDLRVNDGTEATLTYFGMVSQSTGEHWQNVTLRLSTAKPSQSGLPPFVPTQHITCRKEGKAQRMFKAFGSVSQRRSYGTVPSDARFEDSDSENDEELEVDSFSSQPVSGPEKHIQKSIEAGVPKRAVADVRSGFAAQFRISRATTIESGFKPMKTCIGQIPMQITRTYYVTPAHSEKAFFHISAKNLGQYPLLPSTDVRCFMDGNFVCKSIFPSVVSPGDTVQAYMGSDSFIRISHKHVRSEEKMSGSYFSLARKSKDIETLTVIRNGRSHTIRIAVVINVPKSDTEKVKVEMINPSRDQIQEHNMPFKVAASSPENSTEWESVRVRRSPASGNLIWLVSIPPGTTQEIPLRYTISYPSSSSLITSVDPLQPNGVSDISTL
eukprot:CAMPEP_0114486356 /NCGR_PEP_ID=MMETSP0109-20121206/172_1 /TAXON_ID=29199 /ORGANISM="Chlorarachnion reptans, Strain CCCM449" /LENGTH=671 /DNA_ID=CAMNT_0001662515 /DNA_START=98 /DNA_END=2113 /DNA_ORIENTATION=+